MLTCRNCEALKVDGWQAVNCGNHDMYDPIAEAKQRMALHALHARIAKRLSGCGFRGVTGRDIRVDAEEPGHFFFSSQEPTRFSQLDDLSTEFGTKWINWARRDSNYDSCGYYQSGSVEIEVRDAEGIEVPAVEPEPIEVSEDWGFDVSGPTIFAE